MKTLLTDVITQNVNEKLKQDNGFGVSIINLPDIDFGAFAAGLSNSKRLEIYFLGYSPEKRDELQAALQSTEQRTFFYTVEEAEKSRNLGIEDIFRIHFIKNTELEKLSSLRWYDEISMEAVYKKSCQIAQYKLAQSNDAIKNLLRALQRKDIRTILNFERVLDYLEALTCASGAELPFAVSSELYRLGLLADPDFGIGAPKVDEIREQIKRNHSMVRRISNLEQKERQNIASYLSKHPGNQMVRQILDYYRSPSLELLKEMEYAEVEKCLKAASTPGNTPPKPPKKAGSKPTVATSQLIFDGQDELITHFVERAQQEIDERDDSDKSGIKTIEIDGVKIDFPYHASTEKLVEMAVSDMHLGGIIEFDAASPKEALDAAGDDCFERFDMTHINSIREYLGRAASFPEAEKAANAVLYAFNDFLTKREELLPFAKRLQDMPMLQVVSKCTQFSAYLHAYEHLLSEIKDNFKDLFELDSGGAKQVITTIIALDVVYIIGRNNSHAIPTPLNPLYLWKYIKLAEEMLGSRGVPEGSDCYLSDTDKEFIIRKAEDIPDPLALIMLPKNEITRAECLPYSGRLGSMPIYSTKPQIDDSSAGLDAVRQGIIRYMCLYPHSSMMLRISIINPPTVDAVVSMLKKLDRDKEFAAFGNVGIDLTIYRTKETSTDWIEIEDKALNDGMLGRVRGRQSGSFNLSIKNKCLTYPQILQEISKAQHIVVVFDPNEREIDKAHNSRNIHIHPLCVPKVYEYNKMQDTVKIRAANEGGIFADYASIIEKLYEQPSTFGHRNVFVNSPLKKDTYEALLGKTDWLIILDQNLKSWDVSLQSTSERLFYKSADYRSIGIYSKNSRKFAMGYRDIISGLGNYIPSDTGIQGIISATRSINDDGLLSIASHSTNQIFDQKHGKGSLGLAIAALRYKRKYPDAIIVGLDTQLAREWLSDRDDGKLPDLIAIRFADSETIPPTIDVIEVKTFEAYKISQEGIISGHAVEQASVLEALMLEMFGRSEKITTVSRREILREQVFECLFNNEGYGANQKQEVSRRMNNLFAGAYAPAIRCHICHVDFEQVESTSFDYLDEHAKQYTLTKIGAKEIQEILSGTEPAAVEEIRNVENAPAEQPAVAQPLTNAVAPEFVQTETSTANLAPSNSSEVGANNTVIESGQADEVGVDPALHEKCVRLNVVLKSYGIQSMPVDESLVQQAARFTRFKVELRPGETEANLIRRSSDIARELEAVGEIFISRIKGTRYIGIDVPFSDGGKALSLTENLSRLNSSEGSLNFLAGQAPDGEYHVVDLAKAPHMLVAGTTGSGKSVFLNSIIVSLLSQYSREELELIIIDPKQMDFYVYNDLPYLRNKKVYTDAEEAIELLEHIRTVDMPERIKKIQGSGSKNIISHNERNPHDKLKYLVVVIDEYSALVNAASMKGKKVRDTFEKNLCTLVFMARSFGIHIVVATQYPTANYVTSALKVNLPFRVSFRLPSHTDSQTILDRSGAEDLLGKGDMLMLTESDLLRLQGFYISDGELIDFIEKKKKE